MPVKKTTEATTNAAPVLKIKRMSLVIIGDSPFISHAWSSKAKGMMRDKYQKTGKSVSAREARNPVEEFQDSMYVVSRAEKFEESFFGFPALGFKASAINALSTIPGITKTMAKQVFHIKGVRVGEYELVPIFSKSPVHMREDMVRNVSGTTDMRYRGELIDWFCRLDIRYNADALSEEQIKGIFNNAGFGSGIGEWRPSTNGSNGMFHVAEGKELEEYSEIIDRLEDLMAADFGG